MQPLPGNTLTMRLKHLVIGALLTLTACAGARTSPGASGGEGGQGNEDDGGSGGSGARGGLSGTGGRASGGQGGRATGGSSGAGGGLEPDGGALGPDAGADPGPGEPDSGVTTEPDGGAPAPRDGGANPPAGEPPTCARQVPVNSLMALATAIGAAKPGDCVVLANGSYASAASIGVGSVGTAAARITITAETIGGVTISGAAGFRLEAPAAYVTIRGFKFTHAAALVMNVGTSHCLVTRNVFELTASSGDYLWVQGLDQEVSYNLFQNKAYAGAMVQVDASGRDHAGTQRPYFHHNHWLKHSFTGANGGECLATWGGFTRAEYNLFQDCSGDPEIVTAKASDGSYRFNTFRGSTRGMFSMRYSNRTVVDGNFFFGLKGGVRLYGKDHKVTNNYFEGNSGVGIIIADGNADGTYIQIERMLIAHNTLVNDGVMARGGGLPPLTVTFANNLIQKDSGSALTDGPGWQVTYTGNLLWGNAAPGAIPASGYRKADPKLQAAGGVSHIGAGSAAIDGAVGTYGLTQDMDGQPRTGTPDIGADELSTAPVERRPLTPADVGPSAGI
jgi:poly(beta-D-mannuronate) lyase